MKLQMKLGAVSGLLALLIPAVISCNGINSNGDIKEQIVNPNWTAVDSTFGSAHIYAIAYGGGKFVAMGYFGIEAYSTDGVNWTSVDSTFEGAHIYAIAFDGGKFVAVGDSGKAAYSTDGINWTAVSDPKFGSSNIRAIAYGGGKFVAGGEGGGMFYTETISAKLVYNADGWVSWVRV